MMSFEYDCMERERQPMKLVPPRGSGWVMLLPIVDFRLPIGLREFRLEVQQPFVEDYFIWSFVPQSFSRSII